MSVYIPGMEMPTSCMLCPFCVEEADPANGEMCMVTGSLMPPCTRERLDNCPLVPVPPHGDLIDRDALTDAIDSTDWYHQAPNKEMAHGANSAEHQAWYKEQDIYSAIDDAPTIIPADKEGEG